MIAGFNCRVIGNNLLLINNTACVHGFKMLFFFRIAFGIAGFASLFALCFASFAGVRHYKQGEANSMVPSDMEKGKIEETMEEINPSQPQNGYFNQYSGQPPQVEMTTFY